MPGFYVSEGRGQDEVRLAFVLDETRLARAAALLALAVNATASASLEGVR